MLIYFKPANKFFFLNCALSQTEVDNISHMRMYVGSEKDYLEMFSTSFKLNIAVWDYFHI